MMNRSLQPISVIAENIYVGDRLRKAVDPERVASLAASIERIGLMTPITIRTVHEMEIDGVKETDVPVLVAGLHRLEAVKSLGMESIPCIEIDGSDIEAQLWEIAENLHRAELTALERDQHIAKWVGLNEQRLSQSETVSRMGPKKRAGIRAAERELGIQKDDAARAIKVAALSQDAKQAAIEAGLDDNRTALLAAAREETPAAQKAVIAGYAEKKSSAKRARKVAAKRHSRTAKWQAAAERAVQAIEELIELQSGYAEWADNLPENLQSSATADKLQEIAGIDFESALDVVQEAAVADLPLGFGRDG